MSDPSPLAEEHVREYLSTVSEGDTLALAYRSDGADGGVVEVEGPVTDVHAWGERVQYVDLTDREARPERTVRVNRAGQVMTVRGDGGRHPLGPVTRIRREPGEDPGSERADGGSPLLSDAIDMGMSGNGGDSSPVDAAVMEHEPYDLTTDGMGGVSKQVVVDVIQSIAGSEPFQDGTRPHKIHSRKVRAHLAPGVELETVHRIVQAFERLNLLVSAKKDGRFSDGVNLRALTVVRKAYTEDYYPERSPWWDSAGRDPEDGDGDE